MNADDEGYVEALMIIRMSNSNEQDLMILQNNGFIKLFDNLVVSILDWDENNWIRQDRKQESFVKLKVNGVQSAKDLRKLAYKNSSLPYSFEYKTRREYVGSPCAICKTPMDKPSLDHIVPISQGGTHEVDNIRWIHRSCNYSRKNNASDVKQVFGSQVTDISQTNGRQVADERQPQVRIGKVSIGKDNIPPAPAVVEEVDGSVVNSLISEFQPINPSYSQLFKRKPQRAAIERLLKQHGENALRAIIQFLKKTNGKRFAPTITTPIQLEERMGALVAFTEKIKDTSLTKQPKEIIGL